MDNESKKIVQKPQRIVLGRVIDSSGRHLGSISLVDKTHKNQRITCDSLGFFKIYLVDLRIVKLVVERDSIVVSQIEFDPKIVTGELLVEIPPRPIIQEDSTSVMLNTSRLRLSKDSIVNQLRTLTAQLAFDEQLVEKFEQSFFALQDISNLSWNAVSGDPSALKQLRIFFEPEVPFDFDLDIVRFKPAPRDFGIEPCHVLPPMWGAVRAGMMMDIGGGTKWAGKAVSALLRYSESVLRVTRALSGLEIGQVGKDILLDALLFTRGVVEQDAFQLPIWEVLHKKFSGFGGYSPIPRFNTFIDLCNWEWLECAHTFVTAPPPSISPPPLTTIDITDILEGQVGQIRLTPFNGSFGNTPSQDWGIMFSGVNFILRSWSSSEIVIEVPETTPPGCYSLNWIVFDPMAKYFNKQSDACAIFFGGGRGKGSPNIPLAKSIQIGNISIVGKPSVLSFTADNVANQLNAEGCTPVEIAWNLDRLVCSGSTSTCIVDVTDDIGTVLFHGMTIKHKISVTESEDRSYTLTAKNILSGGIASSLAVATLRVERFQRLKAIRKISPIGLVRTGSVVTIEVEVSCPADDPAIVIVSSDFPSRCPSLKIPIPIGQKKAIGQVKVGDITGRVTLSGTVSGVNQAPVRETFIIHNPSFDALLASSLEQCDGGFVTVRIRGATSVSTIGLSGPGGFVPSNHPLKVIESVPIDPASGTLQVTAQFEPLLSGTYAVQVLADDVMLASGQVSCAVGNPSVGQPTVTPNNVLVCVSTQVTISATSRRATELSITQSDGTVVGGPIQGTNLCGILNVTATVQITGTTTFQAIAKRTGSPTATASVTVGESASGRISTFVMKYGKTKNLDGTFTPIHLYVAQVFVDGTFSNPSKLITLTFLNETYIYTPSECEYFRIWALLEDDPYAIADTSKVPFDSGICLGHPLGQIIQTFVG